MAWTSEYMAQDTSSQELEHFGIKGMKWGVRKKSSVLRAKNGVTLSRSGLKIPSSVDRGRNLARNGEKIKKQSPILRSVGVVAATSALHSVAFSYMRREPLRAIRSINATTRVAQGALAISAIAGARRWRNNRDLQRYYNSVNGKSSGNRSRKG